MVTERQLQQAEAAAAKARASFEAAQEKAERARLQQRQRELEQENSLRLLSETLATLVSQKVASGEMATKAFQAHIKYAEEPKRAFAELAYQLATHPVYGLQSNQGLYWNFKPYASLSAVAKDIEVALVGEWDRLLNGSGWLVAMLYASQDAIAEDRFTADQIQRLAVDAALASEQPLDRPEGLTLEHESLLAGLGVGKELF